MIGSNIKRIRQALGYSLRSFAEKVNVSASFISQVETNKISPSLAKLKDIADSLNTTVGILIGEIGSSHSSLITREHERKHSNYKGEGINVYMLTSPDQNKQMEPLLFKMAKNSSSGDKPYQHFGQEFVIVLKGKCEIELGETKHILNKGDSIYFNSSIPHLFKNLSSKETELIWVVTPPSF
jgi:transcriptional regulator with XRE-family HTH domain